MIQAILAVDGVGGVSANGIMPWPKNQLDMKRFSRVTKNKTIIMGRSTWEASDMPSPLPNRKNIVITHDCNYKAPGADDIIHSLPIINELAKLEPIVIIGGANLICQLWESIDILHLTRIAGSYECDTRIPLPAIYKHFELIENIQVNNMTVFETYISKRIINESISSHT